MKKTLIFDLDGTLLNTLEDLQKSTNYALKQFDFPERTLDEIRKFVGNGIRLLIKRALPEGTDEATVDAVMACMKAYYAEHSYDHTVPYPGIPALLERLRSEKHPMAIVSNKADPLIQLLWKRFFTETVPFATGERPEFPRKPQPDLVRFACEQLGTSLFDAVYIGDSEVDALTAKNCGVPCILVGWGFRDPDFLRSVCDAPIAMTTEELYQMLLEV